MQADQRFTLQSPAFWATVRTIGQELGYARSGQILTPRAEDLRSLFGRLDLSVEHLDTPTRTGQMLGDLIVDYLRFRSDVLHTTVEPALMDVDDARALFEQLRLESRPTRPFPRNKQKGDKAGPALLTSIVNMILERELGLDCDFDPRRLTTFTRDGLPVRTLARRVDGAYPGTLNPVAIWEIKEYYFTTTFGSRIADGVYETLLDGMELEALRLDEGVEVYHYLIADSRRTWWEMGKPYLCRMVDLLHMGLADEVLFGREVTKRLPELVEVWKSARSERTAGLDLAQVDPGFG